MSETTVTIPNELEICVERVFDAPRAHVFSDVPEPPADARVAQSMMNFGEQRRGIRELRSESKGVVDGRSASPGERSRHRRVTTLAQGPPLVCSLGDELATICGAAPLAARAESELLATGARPRRVALTGVESLTPSERRVAEMAAEGPTNREIAQALFVTPKTVEVHLSSVYRKLGISARSQLSAALAKTIRG
jgi:DNA-binding NarL/FixJ family response regulator